MGSSAPQLEFNGTENYFEKFLLQIVLSTILLNGDSFGGWRGVKLEKSKEVSVVRNLDNVPKASSQLYTYF